MIMVFFYDLLSVLVLVVHGDDQEGNSDLQVYCHSPEGPRISHK